MLEDEKIPKYFDLNLSTYTQALSHALSEYHQTRLPEFPA